MFNVHHQMSILAIYLNIVLGQTAVAVLLTVWILDLHFRDDKKPPSKRMLKAAFLMQTVMCTRKKNSVSWDLRRKKNHHRKGKKDLI